MNGCMHHHHHDQHQYHLLGSRSSRAVVAAATTSSSCHQHTIRYEYDARLFDGSMPKQNIWENCFFFLIIIHFQCFPSSSIHAFSLFNFHFHFGGARRQFTMIFIFLGRRKTVFSTKLLSIFTLFTFEMFFELPAWLSSLLPPPVCLPPLFKRLHFPLP